MCAPSVVLHTSNTCSILLQIFYNKCCSVFTDNFPTRYFNSSIIRDTGWRQASPFTKRCKKMWWASDLEIAQVRNGPHMAGPSFSNCLLNKVHKSLWMCGGAGILSLHCGYVVTLEYCHFTVGVWWRWNIVTSLWTCGGALSCWQATFYLPQIAAALITTLSRNST